jgi:hypothetical protein
MARAGHVVFHGPIDEALPFFEAQGFRLPERKGLADFLQEACSLSAYACASMNCWLLLRCLVLCLLLFCPPACMHAAAALLHVNPSVELAMIAFLCVACRSPPRRTRR